MQETSTRTRLRRPAEGARVPYRSLPVPQTERDPPCLSTRKVNPPYYPQAGEGRPSCPAAGPGDGKRSSADEEPSPPRTPSPWRPPTRFCPCQQSSSTPLCPPASKGRSRAPAPEPSPRSPCRAPGHLCARPASPAPCSGRYGAPWHPCGGRPSGALESQAAAEGQVWRAGSLGGRGRLNWIGQGYPLGTQRASWRSWGWARGSCGHLFIP